MKYKYKIISFDYEKAQIVVQFSSSKFKDLLTYNFDLPIDENLNIPTKEKLHEYIKNLIPKWYFEKLIQLKKGLKKEHINYIKSLLNKEFDV